MLPAVPSLIEFQPLSTVHLTHFEQNTLPLPSIHTAFPNRFAAIQKYAPLFWDTSDTNLEDKVNNETFIDGFLESGNDSTVQESIQQEISDCSSSTSMQISKYFICQYCGKKLKTKRNLLSHERIHENERPFSCEICDKTFRMKEHLKEHLYTHTNARPFECAQCGKCFRHRSVLHFHKTIHRDTLDHKCTVCFKEFRLKANLTANSYIHRNLKPYQCNCGKGFNRRWYLERHLIAKTHRGHVAELENPT